MVGVAGETPFTMRFPSPVWCRSGRHGFVNTNWAGLILAQRTGEIVGVLAVAIMLVGVWLQWRRHDHVADVEDDIKNAKLTEEQGWRRARWIGRRANAVLVVGVLLLLGAAIMVFE